MAKPAAATYEMVANAADAMVKAGQVPSQRLLIDKIGGGSYSTIGPHLRRWKAARDAAVAALGATDTPRNVEVDLAVFNVVRRAQADLRAELQSDLEDQAKEIEQLTAERDGLDSRRVELVDAAADLHATGNKLQGQVETMRVEIDSLRKERSTTTAALEELRGMHGQLTAEKAGLEAHVAELVSAAERQDRAVDALEQRASASAAGHAAAEQLLASTKAEITAALAIERKGRAEAEQRVLNLTATIDAHTSKLEKLAAAEAIVKELRLQIEQLTGMLKPPSVDGAVAK